MPNKEPTHRIIKLFLGFKERVKILLGNLDKISIALWIVSLLFACYCLSHLQFAAWFSGLLSAYDYNQRLEKQSDLRKKQLLGSKGRFDVSKETLISTASEDRSRRKQELEEFCNGDPDCYTQSDFSRMLQYFKTECYLMPETESIELFKRILSVAESVHIAPGENDWHYFGFETLGEIKNGKGVEYEAKLMKTWLEVIKDKQGERSPNYRKLLEHYMYKKKCPPEEIESMAREIVRVSNDKRLEPSTISYFALAENLARFGLGGKAEEEWQKGIALTDWSDGKRSLHACISLIKTLRDYGFASQADRLVDTLFSKSRPEDLVELEQILGDIYEINLIDGNFEKAAGLVAKRLSIPHSSPSELWQIRRSDLMLISGKVKESNQLFQKAVSRIEKTGKATKELKAKRLKLIEHWKEWRGSKLYKELAQQ